MARRKRYTRPDGLREKSVTIGGRRHVFRGHSENEIMQKIADFREREERGPTFEEMAGEWWEQHEPLIRHGTVHGYKAAMGRAVEYFGSDPVKQIEAADINAFLLYTAKRGYAQKTVKNQLTVVRQIFLYALMTRHIKTLPTEGVRIPQGLSHSSRELAPPDAVEIIKSTTPDDFLLPALKAIFVLAFKPGAVTGGLVGGGIRLALQYGVARGLFSNESGMGSAPLVASAAQTRNPVRQALVSATGTFWTTVVVCLMTGLVLVSSMMKNPAVSVENMANGGQMTTAAFAQIPYIGPLILMVSIITFAYSTILGWSYYGERAAEYLLGKKAILPYKVLFIAVVMCAPVLALDLVWTIADVLNALMAIPNLIAVLLLSGVIAAETKHYLKHLDEKDESEIPVVDR